jgi:hypothetical protein
MAFEIDIGFTSLTGKKDINEDFAAAMLPEPGREAMGAMASAWAAWAVKRRRRR